MTLTDEIRKELREGLRKGVKYEQIRAKYDRDKGPFYNALETVFTDIGAEIESLISERDKLVGQVKKARSDLERISSENEAGERRSVELEGRVSELERAEKNIQQRIGKLDRDLSAKAELLDKSRAIEGLGFTPKKLEKLGEKVTEICAKRGIDSHKAIDVFLRDLTYYDSKLGWELEVERQKTLARTKSSEADRWRAEAKRLELKYARQKETIDELEGLMKRGVRGDDILAWSQILGSVEKSPDEFAEELENYRKLELILSAKIEEIHDLKRKIGALKSQVAALEKRKAEVEASIKSIADSGVREIEKVGNEVLGELSSLMSEVRRFGSIKSEAGQLEQELMIARYFTIKDPIAIKLLPRGAVTFLLEKVKLWCEFNGVNPKVELPEWMRGKYLGLSSFAEVGLVDLLRWAYDGMLKFKVEK